MNIERLTEIAEWLEAGAPHKGRVDGFDMRVWYDSYEDEEGSPCNTVCCIGGAAEEFFSKESGLFDADAILDLEWRVGNDLWFGEHNGQVVAPLRDIGAAWAARCVRKLIATGEVDWAGTKP